MNNEFRNFLHTAPSCPFCGHTPDDVILAGLNCSVCQPCYETINYWSPSYAKLFTKDGVFELWEYLPVAQEWRDNGCANAVFLEPQPAVTELSESTRRAIVAFVEDRYRDVLERAPLKEVEMKTVTLRVPKPVIVTGDWVYAKDISDARQEDNEQRTQATLGEAV